MGLYAASRSPLHYVPLCQRWRGVAASACTPRFRRFCLQAKLKTLGMDVLLEHVPRRMPGVLLPGLDLSSSSPLKEGVEVLHLVHNGPCDLGV